MIPESPSPFYRFTDRATCGALIPRKLEAEEFHPAIRLAHVSTGVVTAPREVFDFCLVYFFAASGICQVDGVDHSFDPRTLLVEPPFKPSHFDMDPAMPTRHVAVHFDIREGFPDRKPIHLRQPYRVDLSRDLEIPVETVFPDKYPLAQTLLQLVGEWQRQDTVGRLQANALLSQLLLDAYRFARASQRPREHARVRRSAFAAVRYIEEHYAEPIGPERIAEAVGYSANYLNRTFRTEIGSSMMAYLTTVRMRRAMELLREPRHSVKKVAHAVGYRSSQHFSRTFQDLHGVTPTQWRRMGPPLTPP